MIDRTLLLFPYRLLQSRLGSYCFCLAVALALSSGCTSEKPDVRIPDLDISTYWASSDTTGYTAVLETNHHSIRRILNTRLSNLLTATADSTSTRSVDTSAETAWLVEVYTSWSGVHDLEKKLRLYLSWNSDTGRQKLALDSLFRAADSAHRIPGDDFDYLTELRSLREKYLSIGDSFYVAATDRYMAKAFFDKQEMDSALFYNGRSLELAQTLDDCTPAADCCLLEAKIRSAYLGDFFTAQEILLKAAEGARRIGDKRKLAFVLTHQGYCAQQLFQSSRARTLFSKAQQQYQAARQTLHEAYCLNLIAETYLNDGMLDSATHYAQEAECMVLELAEKQDDEIAIRSIQANLGYKRTTLGVIAMTRSDLDEASHWFERAESSFEAADDTIGLCANRGKRAILVAKQGRYSEAMELCRFVLRHSTKFESQIHSIYGLALGHLQSNEFDHCRDNLHIGIQRLEDSRDKMLLVGLREGMLSDKTGFYTLMALTYIREAELNDVRGLYDSAYIWFERGKAQTLNEQLEHGPGDTLMTAERVMIDSISNLENRLILMQNASDTIQSELTRLTEQLLDWRIVNTMEPARSPKASPTRIDRLIVQNNILRPGDVLLEYCLTPLDAHLFALTSESLMVMPLDITSDSLNELARRFHQAISHFPQYGTMSSEAIAVGAQLGEILVPHEFLKRSGCRRLLVVASGHLQQLPFEALINHDGTFLVERYQIAYAPSAGSLNQICTADSKRGQRQNIIVFTDPILSPNTGFDRLQSSAAEADQIKSLFGDDAVTYVGSDATESNFRTLGSTNMQYLHIATHAMCDPRDPSHSAILLSPTAGISGSGLLHVEEIASMHLPVDLVFLSACRSGGGKIIPGEGVMSLARPFLIAGSKSVIATLWNIDDAGAAEFVNMFYRSLKEGSSVSEALAHSKRQMIESSIPLYQHPYFWSSFVAVGDP